MFIVGMLSWWYTAGWKQRAIAVKTHLIGQFDYFSIDLLIRTLFSPWKQISAGSVRGPVGVQLRAWFDGLISRIIGATVRTIMIIIGTIGMILGVLIGVVGIIIWPLIPITSLIGLTMMLVGWLPW